MSSGTIRLTTQTKDAVIGDSRLTPAARRALAEAAARRSAMDQQPRAVEIDGRAGPDPVRYGDWENKGLASDF